MRFLLDGPPQGLSWAVDLDMGRKHSLGRSQIHARGESRLAFMMTCK